MGEETKERVEALERGPWGEREGTMELQMESRSGPGLNESEARRSINTSRR